MIKAHRNRAISPPARAVTAPSGRLIAPISHIPAADGFVKSDVVRQRLRTGRPRLTSGLPIGRAKALTEPYGMASAASVQQF
jgi:hypothetical protein